MSGLAKTSYCCGVESGTWNSVYDSFGDVLICLSYGIERFDDSGLAFICSLM